MSGQLTDDQIYNILSSQSIGRLACSDGKKPYIVPVTYTYDGEYIYGQTNEGTKLKILRDNPNVCFEVDIINNLSNWQSVIIYGKFEELKKEEAVKAREVLFRSNYFLMTNSIIHSHEHGVNAELDDSTRVKYVMYRIRIKSLTGRFEKQ